LGWWPVPWWLWSPWVWTVFIVLFVVSFLHYVLWWEIRWLHCWPILVWFHKSYMIGSICPKGLCDF
jgi:hypothetical protein